MTSLGIVLVSLYATEVQPTAADASDPLHGDTTPASAESEPAAVPDAPTPLSAATEASATGAPPGRPAPEVKIVAKRCPKCEHGVWLAGDGATDGARIEFGYELTHGGSGETIRRSDDPASAGRRTYMATRLRVYGLVGKPDEKKPYAEFLNTKSEAGLGLRLQLGGWIDRTEESGAGGTSRLRYHAGDLKGEWVGGMFVYQRAGQDAVVKAFESSWAVTAGYRLFASTAMFRRPTETRIAGWTAETAWANTTLHALDIKLSYARTYKPSDAVAVFDDMPEPGGSAPVRIAAAPTVRPKIGLLIAYTVSPRRFHDSTVPVAMAFAAEPKLEGASGEWAPFAAKGSLRFDVLVYLFTTPVGSAKRTRFGFGPFVQPVLYGSGSLTFGLSLRIKQSSAQLEY